MDVDVDFDFDSFLENDPIKSFLVHKLKEAKLETEELQNRLEKRKNIFENIVQNNELVSNEGFLQIGDSWQTIVDEKHVFGIELLNTSDTPLGNLSVFLPSSHPLTYSTKLYGSTISSNSRQKHQKQLDALRDLWEDTSVEYSANKIEWFETDKIEKQAILVIAIEELTLHKQSTYEIDGLLKYEEEDNKVNHIKLPRLNLSVFGVLYRQVFEETLQAFLASLSTTFKATFFVAFTSGANTTLNTLLSDDTFFKKIDVNFKGTLFKISQSGFFGILQVTSDEDGLENLSIYFRNEQSVFAVLQHLYKRFETLLVLPHSHKSNYLRLSGENKNLENALQEFKASLKSEIRLAVRFFKQITNKNTSTEDRIILKDSEGYKKFRLELAELEFKTDSYLNKLRLAESE